MGSVTTNTDGADAGLTSALSPGLDWGRRTTSLGAFWALGLTAEAQAALGRLSGTGWPGNSKEHLASWGSCSSWLRGLDLLPLGLALSPQRTGTLLE